MKKPRKRKRCPACLVGGYTQGKAPVDGRPLFKCTRCNFEWSHGRDGGEYALESVGNARGSEGDSK